MKKIIVTVAAILMLLTAYSQDFRNVSWGDSPEQVLKKETLPLVNKTNSYKLIHLNFVEFTESDVYFTYTYIFHNNKLIGVKTKAAFLTKDNSRPNIEQLYHNKYISYLEKYKQVNEVVENNIHKFNIAVKDKKIYVEMKKEENEYFLIESIISTKKG